MIHTDQDKSKKVISTTKGNIKKTEHLLRVEDNNEVRPRVSVAIDFGTSNCAVAYSTESKRNEIIVIDEWLDGTITHGKIPTSILFNRIKNVLYLETKPLINIKNIIISFL